MHPHSVVEDLYVVEYHKAGAIPGLSHQTGDALTVSADALTLQSFMDTGFLICCYDLTSEFKVSALCCVASWSAEAQ
jgi:hypothetical protein